MMSININRFILTPARVCDLEGLCDQSQGVPCRIKAGPRRWLTCRAIPEELGVTLWQEKEGSVTYRRKEPVQISEDPEGGLVVDLVDFVREYFGREQLCFCSSEDWKWYKTRGYADTFLDTDLGLAACRHVWLDMHIFHTNLYLMPGALTLGGQDVRHIYWEAFCHNLSGVGDSMGPVVEALLRTPHALDPEEVLKYLKRVECLEEEGFARLHIRTDRGVFEVNDSLMEHSFRADMPGVGTLWTDYAPDPETSSLTKIDILLRLMQADGEEELRTVLETCQRLGLLRGKERPD